MAILIFFGIAIGLWLHAANLATGQPGPLGSHPASLYWLALALAFFGIALYGLRERLRLIYGLLELAIGGAILLGALNSWTASAGRELVPIVGGGFFHRPPEGWLQWSTSSVAMLPVVAAVYIIVRGLDNVGEGLHQLQSPLWSRFWRWVFPKAKRSSQSQNVTVPTAAAPIPDGSNIVTCDTEKTDAVTPS